MQYTVNPLFGKSTKTALYAEQPYHLITSKQVGGKKIYGNKAAKKVKRPFSSIKALQKSFCCCGIVDFL